MPLNTRTSDDIEASLIAAHEGHRLGVVVYDGEPSTVVIECEDCVTTLHDLDFVAAR